MPKAEESRVYLELTQYSLHAVRAAGGVVQAGGECVLENKASLEALLDAIAPDRKESGLHAIAAVWPASTQWYVSTDTEAMLDRTDDSLKAIAFGKQEDRSISLAYSVCGAAAGEKVTPDGMDKWVMAFSPVPSLEEVSKGLMDLNVDPEDVKPAGLPGIGAIIRDIKLEGGDGAVALWDIGSRSSNLVLVTGKGAEGSSQCSAGMENIYQAVQTALKLKFRGAGERLFFNEGYDFTDPGPKIGSIIAASVKEALAALPPTATPPKLACLGLTGKQAWFLKEVAAAAGTTAWEPDITKLAAGLGLSFAESAPATLFSATSAGLLGLVGSKVSGRESWYSDWVEAEGEAIEEPPPPEIEEEEPEPEPVAPPPPVVPERTAPPARAKPSLTVEKKSDGTAQMARPGVSMKSVTAPPFGGGAPAPPRPPTSAPPPAMRPPAAAPSFPSAGAPPPPAFPSATPAAPALSFRPPPGPPAPPPSFSNPGFPTPTMPPMPMPSGSGFPPPPSFPGAGSAAPSLRPPPGPPAPPPSFSNPGFSAPTMPPMPMPAAAMPPPPPAPGATQFPQPLTALPFDAGKVKGLGSIGSKAPFKAGTTTPFKGEPSAAPFGATQAPFGATQAPFGATQAPFGSTQAPFAQPPKSRLGLYIGIGVAAAIVFAGIAIVVESRLENIKLRDQQAAAELQSKIDDSRRAEEAKQAAIIAEKLKQEDAAALKEAEAVSAANAKAELLRQQESDRLARLPGTILVTTVPTGAAVSIDGGPSSPSPVRAINIVPGPHKISVSLPGYDPVETSAEVKGGATVDLGSIPLLSALGGVDLTSTPDSLAFVIRSAGDLMAAPVRTGRTPASFSDLMHGDYTVTFSRPGCRDHIEKLTVAKGARSPVTTVYVDGSLDLTSDPSGASVSKDGEFLGTTPLTLHDLTPKVAEFVLTLPGYDPTPVSCEIPEGQTLRFDAQILRKDRVFTAAEVKTPPQKIDAPAPVLSASQRKLGADVLLSFEVTQLGAVANVEVVRTTDDDIARRCKSAVEKWRFQPATAPDDRIVDSRVEIPFNFPAGGP
jgi:TonB family protein